METLEITRAGGIVSVMLNRPDRRNAMSPTMFRELRSVAEEIASRPEEDRVVVLSGAGPDFCAGADIDALGDPRYQSLPWLREVGAASAAVHAIPQPTIAKLRGICVGGGANLALACDLIVADPTLRFSEIFVRRGLSVDFGGSYALPRRVGMRAAMELALLGEIIGGEEAVALGLLNRLVPEDELDSFVMRWATQLAAGPPLALSLTKRLLASSFEHSLADAVEAEGVAQALNFTTADSREALAAFVEKREARFRGR